jgi:sugar/nucleoside kinase (ribokinase family)
MAFDVVGLGASSVDAVAVLPACPQMSGPFAKMRIREHSTRCGGQTATALAACARLGLRASYIGAVGSDANGRLVRETLAGLGVDLSHVVVHEGFSQFAFVLVDATTGERIVLWDRDERLRLADHELPVAAIETCRLLHVDDVDEHAALAAARIAGARGIPVTSDIDRLIDTTAELVDAVTVAILAEHVPPALTGRTDVREALAAMPRRPGQVLCVTLGRQGALAVDDAGVHEQAGFEVPVKDATGAGDVFRGGFIYARLSGRTLDEQLRFANAAAAISCTRPGAIASVPALEEIEALLR